MIPKHLRTLTRTNFGNVGPEHVVRVDEDSPYDLPLHSPAKTGDGPKGRPLLKTFMQVDLNVAHNDLQVQIAGDIVEFKNSGNGTDVLSFRFCEMPGDLTNDPYPMHPGERLRFPFKVLQLTNAVQPLNGGANVCTFVVILDPNKQVGFQ